MLSRNHSDPIWAMKAPRRLKNVIVTMDWVPDVTQLQLEGGGAADSPPTLSPEQERALRKAFEMVDADGSQELDAEEVGALLKAAGVEEDVEDVMARADAVGTNPRPDVALTLALTLTPTPNPQPPHPQRPRPRL